MQPKDPSRSPALATRSSLAARLAAVACGFAAAVCSLPAPAQEPQPTSFRVDTDLYTDLTKPPVKRTLTLFSEGVFYDFGTDNDGLLTVIDPIRGRIVLIDETLQIRAAVDCDRLRQEIDAAAAQTPPEMIEVSTSRWDDTPEGKVCTVGNPKMEYRCTVVPAQTPDAAEQFASFADWSSRLNAAYAPLPPYLRLRLNAMVAEAGMLPKQITRVAKGNQVYAISSPIWQLSVDDRQRIRKAGELMASATEVSPQEFWAKQ